MLNIFIEMKFLEEFYNSFDGKTANSAEKVVMNLLKNYPETKWYMDCTIESPEQLQKLKTSNPLFAKKADYLPPKPVDSIDINLIRQENKRSCIVFTYEDKVWFGEAEKVGVMCFSHFNFKKKINTIIQRCHFRVDLNKQDFSWKDLKFLTIFNKVIINDNYILSDKHGQKIDDNLIPLLKELVNDTNNESYIKIYTQDLNFLSTYEAEKKIEVAEQKKKKLEDAFADYRIKFEIINNAVNMKHSFIFHDRMIITNFQIIDCGKGFNLIPHKQTNSQIISETIFDIYTYKRIKNLIKEYDDYLKKISQPYLRETQFTFV